MTPLERRATDLGLLIRDIVKQFQSVHAHAANGPHVHLSHQELRVIEFLGESGSKMMRTVAEHLGVEVNSLTAIVDALESKGFVTRVRSSEDRRVVHLQLTELGETTFDSASTTKAEFHRSILSVLSDDEQEILLVLFRKMARAGWSQVERISSEKIEKQVL